MSDVPSGRMLTRRGVLRAALAGCVLAPLGAWMDRAVAGGSLTATGYGPLIPAVDQTTGLKLIALPDGFRYWSFGWAGDTMTDGQLTPEHHDGMAVVAARATEIVLARNHEIDSDSGAFGSSEMQYDPAAGGGVATLVFDTSAHRCTRSHASLSGTVRNCAGGPTPWGTWISCEESLVEPDAGNHFTRSHGWCFEVSPEGARSPAPLTGLGRFVHEAIAVDPATGDVYLTEDAKTCGFYRFTPAAPRALSRDGRLEMLAVAGTPRVELGGAVPAGTSYEVNWVEIPAPQLGHTPGTKDGLGVFVQGHERGGAVFRRGEGCWHDGGRIYFVCTDGGAQARGQVWQYTPAEQRLTLLFDSPSAELLDMPDNITVSPRGGLLLCEDGGRAQQRLQGLTADGRLFPFAENQVTLRGEVNNLAGDFQGSEWAGACFHGDWLFANIYRPGITLAITGPWGHGLL